MGYTDALGLVTEFQPQLMLFQVKAVPCVGLKYLDFTFLLTVACGERKYQRGCLTAAANPVLHQRCLHAFVCLRICFVMGFTVRQPQLWQKKPSLHDCKLKAGEPFQLAVVQYLDESRLNKCVLSMGYILVLTLCTG
jgi:hypothetical protein